MFLSLNSYANSHGHAPLLSAVCLCVHSLAIYLQVCVNGSRILISQRRLFLLILLRFADDVHLNPGPAFLSHHTSVFISAFDDFHRLNITIETTSGDEHCFIHALNRSISNYLKIHWSYKSMLHLLSEESNNWCEYYHHFISATLGQFCQTIYVYFNDTVYNSDFADLLPLIAANVFQIRILIYIPTSIWLHNSNTIYCYIIGFYCVITWCSSPKGSALLINCFSSWLCCSKWE